MTNFAVNKPILQSFQLLIISDLQCVGPSFLRTHASECYPSRHDHTGHNDLYQIISMGTHQELVQKFLPFNVDFF